jgi:pyrimidine-specific ribonucleoside hydrolase
MAFAYTRPIIIDCDTGIDDAVAILTALKFPHWQIIGITAVAGNVPLELTAPNSVRVCTLAGKRIPVYPGADKPLYRQLKTGEAVHGANGLGGAVLDLGYAAEEESASSYLKRSARELGGMLELITLGPLTNIAYAVLTDPDFAPSVRHLTMMGGALRGGNAGMAAEFNIYADPEAARIVLQSGIPITMVGLDVTNRALLPGDVVDRWRDESVPAVRATGDILYGYRRYLDGILEDKTALHDPLAVAAAADPSLITTRDLYVDVETKSSVCLGRTVADEFGVTSKAPNVSVALDVDVERFLNFFIGSIESYGSP